MVWGGDISTIQNNINELLKENKKQTIDDYNNKSYSNFYAELWQENENLSQTLIF
jgi:hypothetical protein